MSLEILPKFKVGQARGWRRKLAKQKRKLVIWPDFNSWRRNARRYTRKRWVGSTFFAAWSLGLGRFAVRFRAQTVGIQRWSCCL